MCANDSGRESTADGRLGYQGLVEHPAMQKIIEDLMMHLQSRQGAGLRLEQNVGADFFDPI